MDPALLSLLRCPETHQPLAIADRTVVERLNSRIAAGAILNRAGQAVATPIDSGLCREDGQFLYPVRGALPILLVDEAIPLTSQA